jgi:hypothetical protein
VFRSIKGYVVYHHFSRLPVNIHIPPVPVSGSKPNALKIKTTSCTSIPMLKFIVLTSYFSNIIDTVPSLPPGNDHTKDIKFDKLKVQKPSTSNYSVSCISELISVTLISNAD